MKVFTFTSPPGGCKNCAMRIFANIFKYVQMSATNDELDWHGTRRAYCACLHKDKRVTKCRSIDRAM